MRTSTFLTLFGMGGNKPAYDPFAASIVHAYEPARRVLSSYTGSLVRLRRDSDNGESDFGYLSDNNLDTAAITAWLAGANGYVVTVYDQALAGDDIAQAVAGDQPLYVASAQNGHAGMQFDGTGDWLGGAFTTGGALSQPFSIFALANLDAGVVNDDNLRLLTDGDDAANRIALQKASATAPDSFALYAGGLVSGPAASTGAKLWSALVNGASSQFWLNGASAGTGNAGAHNADGFALGARYDGAVAFWKGTIMSAIICDPSLSDAWRTAMEAAINGYWSVY